MGLLWIKAGCMMLYGIRTTSLGMYQAEQVSCSKCGGENSVKMKVFAKYFHVSRIPSFPLGKIGVAVCQQCQHSVDDSRFGHLKQYHSAYKTIKAKTTVPYWSCAGIMVLFLLLSWMAYNLV